MNRSTSGTAASLLAILVLAGCGDPMKFAEPIGTLQTGTGHIATVIDETMRHVEADPSMQHRICLVAAAASGASILPAQSASATDAAPGGCTAGWREAKDDERVAVAGIWLREGAIHAVSNYIDALERLMQAEEGEALRTATLELGEAVEALHDAAAMLPGNGRLAGAWTTMSGIASFLAGIDSDYARLEALQNAVAAADPVVGRLVDLIAADVQTAHAVRVGRAPVEFVRAAQPIDPQIVPVSATVGAEWLMLPNQVVAFRESDPADALRRLGVAHGSLLRAVTDDSTRNFIEFTYAVEEFARSAREVWQAFGGYTSALNR